VLHHHDQETGSLVDLALEIVLNPLPFVYGSATLHEFSYIQQDDGTILYINDSHNINAIIISYPEAGILRH